MDVGENSEPGAPARTVRADDRWSVRRLTFLILLVGLPLLAFQIFTVLGLRQSREAEIRAEAGRLLELLESEQQRVIDDVRHVLVAISEMGIGRMDVSACRSTMERLRASYPSYLAISVADRAGKVWCSTEAGAVDLDVRDRPYFAEALASGGIITGDFLVSRTTGRPAIPIVTAYPDGTGAPAGVVTVFLDTSWLGELFARKPLPDAASVLVADRSGTVLARVPEIPDITGQQLPERFQLLLEESSGGITEIEGIDGVRRVTAYAPVTAEESGLYMHVGIDQAAAMRSVSRAASWSLLIFGGLLLAMALGSAWGLRRYLQVRDQAQQSALRTAALLASTVDGVIELDREWRFTFLSEQAKSLVAQGRDLLGMTLWEAFPELLDGPVGKNAREAVARRVPVEAEFRGARTGRWLWIRGFPSDVGLSVFVLDVSKRREAEAALRESNERLSLALESAQAGTFDWDLRSGRGHWSEESFRIFGLDPQKDEASTESWLAIVHPDDVDAANLTGRNPQPVEENAPYTRLEYRVVHPDGAVRWVMSIGRVHSDAEGRPVRFRGLNIDMTRQKELEQALHEAKSKADEANMSKSRFLAAASHDLRQPLQSALLFAGGLHHQIRDEGGRSALASLERALDALKDLLNSLLDVSRLDAGVIVPQAVDVQLGPLLEELDEAYAPIAASKGLDFRVAHPAGPLFVHTDRLLLGRMLRNLVENAIRYTEQGFVRLTCEIGDHEVAIQVADSGIGISAEHSARIFDEFYQVANPERDRTQGLGLGLAIVQRLSKLLDHPVSLRSEPGKGALFVVRLPRAAAPEELAAPADSATPAPAPGRVAVLVDDDVIVLMGLRTVFQEWGFDVVVAGSTDQALQRLERLGRAPDIIIADYRLREDRVGTETIRKIREQTGRPVPAIVLTGEIGADCENDAAATDVALVYKPIAPRQLLQSVQRLLDQRG